jgi:hypothetical protein
MIEKNDDTNISLSLKPSEQFLLDWARTEGGITNWDMNDHFNKWCNKFYPGCESQSDRNKLRSKFTYQANKLVKLGYLNKCHRVGLGSGASAELYGGSTTQSIWNLVVPKKALPISQDDDGKSWSRVDFSQGGPRLVPCDPTTPSTK